MTQAVTLAQLASSGALSADTNGNVGIGTSSPSTYGVLVASQSNASSDTYAAIRNSAGGVGGAVQGTRLLFLGDSGYSQSAPTAYIRSVSNDGGSNGHGTLTFGTHAGNGTCPERARIDSSGNLLVGTTSALGIGVTISGGGTQMVHNFNSDYTVASFRLNNTQRGFITTTSTGTTFSTSSDYRLKENIQPMTGALAKVAQLKPCTYKWKADGSDGEGFIAHELAEVAPQCVTGEKDGVDAEGNPKYQGIDTSFLVATLTAAIQELKAELDATKAEVALLKGAA